MKNLLQNISKIFYKKLKYKHMYAIHSGERAGCFFVYLKEEDQGNSYALLMMPYPLEAIYVNKNEIDIDLKYKNIKSVKKLPYDIYNVCRANFIYQAKKVGIYANR